MSEGTKSASAISTGPQKTVARLAEELEEGRSRLRRLRDDTEARRTGGDHRNLTRQRQGDRGREVVCVTQIRVGHGRRAGAGRVRAEHVRG